MGDLGHTTSDTLVSNWERELKRKVADMSFIKVGEGEDTSEDKDPDCDVFPFCF